MRFTKPSWVKHQDVSTRNDPQNAKRLSIFSVHVHPDGSRIATGGLDAKVRIWSTKPILNQNSELSNRPPKSLCTLSMHTGPVLVVRWAHSGRWLASGSDDEIVMIWDLDPSGRGKVFGSNEVNVEGWKPLKRLPGHESDVTDIAWSPEDRYLASVGLDSQVLVWCGYTLERLRKLDQHQGFVKGVCWDPVGEFLATQSDDKSVKIWRTADWELEAEIRKPFEDSPGSTFFRRLSWSPDGAHITASNATNNKGFVFIAAVITRGSWTSEISLVGHENTVEVASYNPHIFLRNPSQPLATANICSVVALGADDRSISIWQTKSARPLIVAREVFERQIMDLSWSWDGLTLYAASSDGTIAVFNFDPEELEGIAPHSAQEHYLKKFNFVPPPLPEGFSHGAPAHANARRPSVARMTPPPSPSRSPDRGQSVGFGGINGVGATEASGGERINTLVAKRGNKKRVQPMLISSVPSASTAPSRSHATGNAAAALASASSRSEIKVQALPLPSQSTSVKSRRTSHSHSASPHDAGLSFGEEAGMDMDVPIDALDTASPLNKGKRKASVLELVDERGERPSKPRTLGGDRIREPVSIVHELAPGAPGPSASHYIEGDILPVAPLLSYLTAKVEGTEDVLEARNADGNGHNEVMFISGKQTQWLDYLPSSALALAASNSFCAVAMQDGSVNVYSQTGRRLMPTLCLGSPCSMIHACRNSLMILSASGQLMSINVKRQRAHFPPVSIRTLLNTPNTAIVSAAVRPNGVPVLQCSSGVAHTYDPQLCTWTKLSERWWAEGSDVWQGRQRSGYASRTDKDVVAVVESTLAGVPEGANNANAEGGGSSITVRPEWWSTALTLGHLESKMHAARALDSPAEYKQALLMYAKKIADEGFRGKAEELIRELYGPIYWRPGREDGSWTPSMLGFSKRELLREVLVIFARSKTLAKLALDWQDTLKRAGNDESV